MTAHRTNDLMGIVIGGLAPLALGAFLVGLRDGLAPSTVALVLVVIVVLAAVAGGRSAGVVAAVSAALTFDFFFTRPFLSLTIDSPDDVETTVLLLVVGLVVGATASRGRRARDDAGTARAELRRVHRLAEAAATGARPAEVIALAQSELADLLGLRSCRFEAPPFTSALPELERNGGVAVRHHRFQTSGFELPEGGVELSVLARGHKVGRFVLDPTPGTGVALERRIVAVAMADQVGAALAATPTEGSRHD